MPMTLRLPAGLAERGRRYAAEVGISLNGLLAVWKVILHTGTLTGSTVLDKDGNPISKPIVAIWLDEAKATDPLPQPSHSSRSFTEFEDDVRCTPSVSSIAYAPTVSRRLLATVRPSKRDPLRSFCRNLPQWVPAT